MTTTSRWKIVIADPEFSSSVSEIAASFNNLDLLCPNQNQNLDDLLLTDVDGLITQDAIIGAELLEKMPGVRIVLKMGRNYQNIDSNAVRDRVITFASVPRKGPNCVAELAITLMLSLSKDILMSHQAVASGAYRYRGLQPEITAQWQMAFHWMQNERVHEVQGKTVGIVGLGEIGCELARRTRVMGMHNLYYKRNRLNPELERRFHAEYRDLENLLRESDYLCLAVPHTPKTEGLIGRNELSLMKKSAFLINICRGGVVDENALISALEENSIAGAGLDVFTYEPLPAESPLCQLDNVILTPHIGGGTGTSRTLELESALKEMDRILSGHPPQIDISHPLAI